MDDHHKPGAIDQVLVPERLLPSTRPPQRHYIWPSSIPVYLLFSAFAIINYDERYHIQSEGKDTSGRHR